MKTLKQIADELGVPKQQVYRYVRAECINEVHHDAVREAVPESLNSIIEAMQAGHAAEIQRLQAELDRLHADLTDTRTALEVERQHSREQSEKLAQLADQAERLYMDF